MFGLSKRELEAKFMKSELVLLAWRSQELSYNMTKDTGTRTNIGKKRNTHSDAAVPENLPDHFFNEEGEVDLRRVTGEEAYRYMSSQGIRLPVISRTR